MSLTGTGGTFSQQGGALPRDLVHRMNNLVPAGSAVKRSGRVGQSLAIGVAAPPREGRRGQNAVENAVGAGYDRALAPCCETDE